MGDRRGRNGGCGVGGLVGEGLADIGPGDQAGTISGVKCNTAPEASDAVGT